MGDGWPILTLALLAGCASVNPFNTSSNKTAHLLGKHASIEGDSKLKENVYFVQVNKKDLRDRWADYPWDMYIPTGKTTLIVMCEWHNVMVPNALATSAQQITQRFILGHEYQFSSQMLADGLCVISVTDITMTDFVTKARQNAAEEKAAAEKKQRKKANKKAKKKR